MYTRFDTEARVAVAQAADIARELGHREVGPDHLLLGLLANTRGTTYAALTDHGLSLDAAREIVAAQHVEPDDDAASSAYEDDREALREIGIDLDRVRQAVRDNLGQDLADGWADRPEGERRGRRGRRGRHHHHHHHHEHDHDHDRGSRGRGRRGPRSSRDTAGRFSRSLRAVLRDVRRSVVRDETDADRGERRDAGMTASRMLVALIHSDDPVVQAVLAAASDREALIARAEAEAHTTTV
jgi:hypothetical protein